jgi:hypothetical protein
MVTNGDTIGSFDRPEEDRWPRRPTPARAEATANVSASLPTGRKLPAAQYRKPKGDTMITFTIDSDGIEMFPRTMIFVEPIKNGPGPRHACMSALQVNR